MQIYQHFLSCLYTHLYSSYVKSYLEMYPTAASQLYLEILAFHGNTPTQLSTYNYSHAAYGYYTHYMYQEIVLFTCMLGTVFPMKQ